MLSRLHLPKLEPAPKTVLEYLIAHFPHIHEQVWRERVANGKVTLDDGATLTTESPYRHGVTVLYSREIPLEPAVPTEETILFQDTNILVADKPHGMVVTPSGDHVERSLLARLQNRTGMKNLAPVHRLDRETAGIVLFAIHTEARGRYHQLFSSRSVEREYLAVAKVSNVGLQKEWDVRNRMEEGEPWYRRRIAENTSENSGAERNAITRIELLESLNGYGLFRLLPETGKKHQLRVHMASIGFPIVGDLLYPGIRERNEYDSPLQLLAHRLSFIDPLSGEPRSFVSAQQLLWPVE
jgi:tRNA pseudouridine32 synthase/23S rRNA pseudouridine746 synthase